jgi:xanthine dehydrogenase/oxidase
MPAPVAPPQVGQTTPFGCVVGSDAFNWTVPTLWANCKAAVGYDDRVQEVADFNAANRFRKRGLCMTPTKYGMGPSGYKVGALVNCFSADGTVEVFHSGTEIGQGISTKVVQAVAMTLGISMDSVVVGDTSTSVVPNGGCTGGSGTSEATVGAAINACENLLAIVAPYDQGDGFVAAAQRAASAGNGLTATGWFNEPSAGDGNFDYASQVYGAL